MDELCNVKQTPGQGPQKHPIVNQEPIGDVLRKIAGDSYFLCVVCVNPCAAVVAAPPSFPEGCLYPSTGNIPDWQFKANIKNVRR